MTRKHWITKKEIKELYNVSDNRIAQMRRLNLVTTKKGVNEGKGRKPTLYKKAMVNALKDYTPAQLHELADVVDDTKHQFDNFTKVGYLEDYDKYVHSTKNDIEAVVEKECVDKYEYSYSSTVDHPTHYNKTNLEVIDAIEAWDLDFSEGNVVKYLLRAKHKNNAKEDLEKALWYVQRLLDNL